jgi:hypothetical protein
MPNLNSYADQFLDWDQALQAFLDNAEILAPAEPQRAALEKTLTALRGLKALQDSHSAMRQQTTQEITVLIHQGREQARRLRGMVKGLLGTKNERLVQFKVAPIRSRARKTAQKLAPAKAAEPADTTTK